jgi:putative membrane protein insertion efficiency factor
MRLATGTWRGRTFVESDAGLRRRLLVLDNVLGRALRASIRVYQLALSPLVGGACRFEPTCSRYADEAIRKYGAFRGTRLAVARLLRCHPLHHGGFDPVP